MCPFERRGEGFGAVQICFDDFVGEVGVFAWIAGQRAHLKLVAGLQRTHDSASLMPRCADYGD